MTDNTTAGDTTFIIPAHVLARQVSGEVVLLSLETEQYYVLDGAGTRLWELIEADQSLRQALMVLSNEFDVDQDVLEEDLQALIEDLQLCGLLRLETTDERSSDGSSD